jgi:hypothetical protein
MADGTADGILDLAVLGEDRGDALGVARGYRRKIGVKGGPQHLGTRRRLT